MVSYHSISSSALSSDIPNESFEVCPEGSVRGNQDTELETADACLVIPSVVLMNLQKKANASYAKGVKLTLASVKFVRLDESIATVTVLKVVDVSPHLLYMR